MSRRAALLALPVLLAAPAHAAPAEGALPHYASLAATQVYLRQGPSYKHRILWVYHRKELPVQVLAQYDVWRRVKMPDGAIGWVHVAMLSRRRTVVVTGKANAALRDGPRPGAAVLAYAEPGVIARLDRCVATACEVRVGGFDGWFARSVIWGEGPAGGTS